MATGMRTTASWLLVLWLSCKCKGDEICLGGMFRTALELERQLSGCKSVNYLKIVFDHDIDHVNMLTNLKSINGDFMLKNSRVSDLSGLSNLT